MCSVLFFAAVGGMAFPAAPLAQSVVIGPAINYTLQWTADQRAGTLSVCVSADNQSSTNWIGVGFSSAPNNQMNASDIVVGGA